ncbi:hypothetical protein RF11_09292 [Thelohanellus kitauei]|uniref:EGF-like domain-containing protein n=1 Tax=Thelohanellus kitauei TaxID=669202 RepID=A0A0C2MT51_THEKT|nr:hypothetical protein RF11_09292 [Thelohanellus kitauei]
MDYCLNGGVCMNVSVIFDKNETSVEKICGCKNGFAGVHCEIQECDLEFDDVLLSMKGSDFGQMLANGSRIMENENTLKEYLENSYKMDISGCNITSIYEQVNQTRADS